MDLQSIGKLLVAAGVGLALLGVMMWLGGRMGLGGLPGDVRLSSERWGCYFPIASMIVLSLILTVVANLVLRIWNR